MTTRPPTPPPAMVTVVLPLRDGLATLPEQLDALAAQDYEGRWELVIADNGSTDGGPQQATLRWSGRIETLRVVDASAQAGVSHARNEGVRHAAGDFVVLCDADDVASPGWLRAMADASTRFDMVGGRLDEASLNDPLIAQVRPPTQDVELPIGLGFKPFSAGANFGVRTEIVRRLGGWRTSYRGGGDDIDFCWRAQAAGYSIGFAADAVMAYRHRELDAIGRQFHDYGLMEAQLYRHHRADGLRRSSTREGLRNWAWIAWHVRDARGAPVERGVWLRKAGHRSGRVRGSLRYRTLYL